MVDENEFEGAAQDLGGKVQDAVGEPQVDAVEPGGAAGAFGGVGCDGGFSFGVTAFTTAFTGLIRICALRPSMRGVPSTTP